MYGCDTGELDAVRMNVPDLKKLKRIQGMSVEEALDIGEAVGQVKGYGHGTGEVCLALVNGFLEAILPRLKKYRKKKAK